MSIYTLRSGGTAHPEETFLQMLTELVLKGGVSDLSSTNNLKVSQRGAGANMSVDIAAGKAFIRKSTTSAYPVRNTAPVNIAIASNSSGNPRIDTIVVYNDLAASPDSTSSNVASIVRVAGTPAASPTAPDDSAIATAVGASNPFLRLADVAVANGAASIVDANITDRRVRYKLRSNVHEADATDASTTTYDFSQNNYINHVLGGNRTLAVTGMSPGDFAIIELIQPASGGPYTPTWWANIDWDDDTEPSLTPTANMADIIGIFKKANGRYRGFIIGQNQPIS